jgi:hypothetical protein
MIVRKALSLRTEIEGRCPEGATALFKVFLALFSLCELLHLDIKCYTFLSVE